MSDPSSERVDVDVEKAAADPPEVEKSTRDKHHRFNNIRTSTQLLRGSRNGKPNGDPSVIPPPRKRRDIVPRRGHVFDLNESGIVEVTKYYEEYSISGTTLKGLAKFDDCRDYGISDASHQTLVLKEIQRIIKVAADEGPFLFESKEDLSAIDSLNFKDLSNLMDQIHCNFAIIKHDNARIGLEHYPVRMERMIGEFKKSRRLLVGRYKQDQYRVQGCQPKLLEPPKRNQELYFAMIDYIIGSVARLIVRTATSKYWEEYTLAILAQWATKLKVIAYDPVKCAAASLSNGEDVIDQMSGNFTTKLMLKVKLGPDSQEQEFDTLDTEADITTLYYEENILFRYHLQALVKFAYTSMYVGHQSGKRKELGPECFEACTLIYKTGLDGVPTALSNDRFGDIYASSDSAHVNCLYGGLELLLRNAEAIKAKTTTREEGNPFLSTTDTEAVVKWEWFEGTSRKRVSSGNMCLSNMDDIISIAVSLGLASSYTAMNMDNLISLASSGASEEDPVMQFEPPQKGFQALFNIASADFLCRQRKAANDRYHDPEIVSVSSSPLKRGIRAGTDLMLQAKNKPHAETKSKTQEVLSEYAKHKQRMDTWVISEDSITIRCRGYVAWVIITALVIVCGCMAVPFAVGTKIRGVDPFQITTFGWIIAGFVTVLAKSRYVSEWPWHHFLRGQVICRSIKDVNEVTGIDPQMILMNLLHGERDNILRTRGPFNGMFGRKAEGPDGFSIDVAVKLSTMLASGFIVLKVINEKGEHLICEDVRKGSRGVSVNRNEEDTFLACKDVGKDAAEDASEADEEDNDNSAVKPSHAKDGEKVLKLRVIEEFRWVKVLGLYIRDSKFG